MCLLSLIFLAIDIFFQQDSCAKFEKEVHVKALSEAASWKLISDGKTTLNVRWGISILN